MQRYFILLQLEIVGIMMTKRSNYFFYHLLIFFSSMLVHVAHSSVMVPHETTFLDFVWLNKGFSLADSTTRCVFDSVCPVSGAVDLRGGTLCLHQDLLFKNISSLGSLGTFEGNNHGVDFCATITSLSQGPGVFENVYLHVNDDLTIDTQLTFKGRCVIRGEDSTIRFGKHGRIIVARNASLELKEVLLDGITPSSITYEG